MLVDGGVRTGADVLKAMALGADAVLVGRPYAFALAVGGRRGVEAVIRQLLAETDITLALIGGRAGTRARPVVPRLIERGVPVSAGRLVLVTGASSGIGEACAVRLSRSGWQVLAGVRTSADGARLSDEGAGRIEPVELDVTEPASIARLTERLGEGALAGLINNAGTAVSLPVELLPLDELRRQLEVNLVGHVAVMQAVLRNLRRVHGRIVNVGSIAGRSALPFLGAYAGIEARARGGDGRAAYRVAPVRDRGGDRRAGHDRDADLA